jgi:hypothetical protein
MPSSNDYMQLLPEILAVKTEEVLTPNMPVDVYVQEAENLGHWSNDDREALAGAGLDLSLIDILPVRAGACREAQSLWIKERNMRKEAEAQWKAESPAAFDLRNHLVHAFRYAFRKDPELLSRVDEIADGDTNADMIQDLNDLSVLGKANQEKVTMVGIAPEMLDNAALVADRMGDILGAANGERRSVNQTLVIRDKAYTLLKWAVDEIRECGRFVFWRNPERLRGYSSAYWQTRNAQRPAEKPAETSTDER